MTSKGQVSEMKTIILTVVVILVALLLIWKFQSSTNRSVGAVQKCSSYSLGEGTCKAICESSEQPFEGLGCEGKANICCIPNEPKDKSSTT